MLGAGFSCFDGKVLILNFLPYVLFCFCDCIKFDLIYNKKSILHQNIIKSLKKNTISLEGKNTFLTNTDYSHSRVQIDLIYSKLKAICINLKARLWVTVQKEALRL